MTDRVLPRSGRNAPIVGKRLSDPGVDVLNRQAFALRRLDGEKGQTAKRVGRPLKILIDRRHRCALVKRATALRSKSTIVNTKNNKRERDLELIIVFFLFKLINNQKHTMV